MTDMERFIAAADEIALKLESITNHPEVYETFDLSDDDAALNEYRAAREAITRGTPPATSA